MNDPVKETKKFAEWKNKWADPTKMGVMNYISFTIHPEDALILGNLFLPVFIEVEQCLFIKESYSEKNYLLWKEKLGDDRIALEKMINHIHVYDIFANCADDIEEEVFENIGKMLQISWTNHLKNTFPAKEIVVDYTNGPQEYGPTLTIYQK